MREESVEVVFGESREDWGREIQSSKATGIHQQHIQTKYPKLRPAAHTHLFLNSAEKLVHLGMNFDDVSIVFVQDFDAEKLALELLHDELLLEVGALFGNVDTSQITENDVVFGVEVELLVRNFLEPLHGLLEETVVLFEDGELESEQGTEHLFERKNSAGVDVLYRRSVLPCVACAGDVGVGKVERKFFVFGGDFVAWIRERSAPGAR